MTTPTDTDWIVPGATVVVYTDSIADPRPHLATITHVARYPSGGIAWFDVSTIVLTICASSLSTGVPDDDDLYWRVAPLGSATACMFGF